MNIDKKAFEKMSPSLICVYSLPRSGSTVLIAELDRIKGVLCLPESYFPQILELLDADELQDSNILAAYFLASSPSGSLLSFEEVKDCIVPGNWNRTLINIGLACAIKTNRDPHQVSVIIWKTTRIVGRWKLFSDSGGRFLILRRNPVNVFESQFRVDFGRHNRNPLRFAFFLESYEAVFSRIPKNRLQLIEYERIPEQLPKIQNWLGVSNSNWDEGESTLAKTHAKKSWHGGLLDGFQSKDNLKRKNVSVVQRVAITSGRIMAKPFWPILKRLRDYYDKGIMKQIRSDAEKILANIPR